jgi:hypothetical protein
LIEILQRRPAALAARPADSPIAEFCSTVRLELDSRRVMLRPEF